MVKQYVVLPSRGIVSETMSVPILSDSDGERSIDELIDGLSGAQPSAVAANPAMLEFAREKSSAREWSFSVRQSYAEDGPKLARMAPEAERVLRAAGYRLVPVTRYRLAIALDTMAVQNVVVGCGPRRLPEGGDGRRARAAGAPRG